MVKYDILQLTEYFLQQSNESSFKFLFFSQPGIFLVYFQSFQTNNTIFTTNQCWKMSIQYMVLGFEPTTSQAWVVTHNH